LNTPESIRNALKINPDGMGGITALPEGMGLRTQNKRK